MSIVEILPSNRTRLEEGLVIAFDNLLNSSNLPFSDLLNAQQSPNETLLYLANDRGVTTWLDSDSEELKRNLTSENWLIKRFSGTKTGLERAVSPFGYDGFIESPQAYKLNITAYKQGNTAVDAENIHRIEASINQAKNERDDVSLVLGMGNESSLAFSGASNSISLNKTDLDSVLPTNNGTTEFLFSGVRHSLIIGHTTL